MTTTRQASCACGALSVRAAGEPAYVSSCACQACQRRTGSAYGVTVFYRAEQVTEAGEAQTYRRVAESGNTLDFRFCPTCGTTVWWTPHARPGMVCVAGGCFAATDFPPAPQRMIWMDFKPDWVEPPAGAAEFPRGPDA